MHPAPTHEVHTWDGRQLLAAFRAAAAWLDRHRESVNAMNVFPVPDGDTGTNMALTLNDALRDVPPDSSPAVVAARISDGTLMYGRGNSGIILSQALRGFAQALERRSHIEPNDLAAALANAATTARRSVLHPVEGTMLTVLDGAMQAAQQAIMNSTANLRTVLEHTVEGARAALARTPYLLEHLRRAGVVDAGGQGLVLLFEGLLRYARGEALDYAPDAPVVHAEPLAVVEPESAFGYCTSFLLLGANLHTDTLNGVFAELGDSVLVVGDQRTVKVHVHTPRPGDALNIAVQYGTLDRIVISNMDLEYAARHPQPDAAPVDDHTVVGVLALSDGAGLSEMLRGLRARVLEIAAHAETLELVVRDALLETLSDMPQREIMLLGQGLAAHLPDDHPALVGRMIAELPVQNPAEAIAALTGFGYHTHLEDNLRTMQSACRNVRTALVVSPLRTLPESDGIVVVEQPQIATELIDRLELAECELLTVYIGRTRTHAAAEHLVAAVHRYLPELVIEVLAGGQTTCEFLLAAE